MFIPRLFPRELSNDHTNAGQRGRERFQSRRFHSVFLVSLTELLGNKSEVTSAESFAIAALNDEDNGAPIDMKLIQVWLIRVAQIRAKL